MRKENRTRGWAVFLALTCLFFSISASAADSGPDGKEGKIFRIGLLLTATPDRISASAATESAVALAVDEANEFLLLAQTPIKLEILTERLARPEDAPAALQRMHEAGARFAIGPLTSQAAQCGKAWSDANGILMLSNASTAPSLAIPGDNLYRFVPGDIHQARALAAWLAYCGRKHVVVLQRDDVYGRDFTPLLKDALEKRGGSIRHILTYGPDASSFGDLVTRAEESAKGLIHDVGESHAGVVLVSFSEAIRILKDASSRPALRSLSWYGTDGIALNDGFITDPDAARMAQETGLSCTTFSTDKTVYYRKIYQKISERLGRPPQIEALVAYDLVWVISAFYDRVGDTGDLIKLRSGIENASRLHAGVSGWMMLDENGDRQYGIYDIWQVMPNRGETVWQNVARYRRDPGLPGCITPVGQSAASEEMPPVSP